MKEGKQEAYKWLIDLAKVIARKNNTQICNHVVQMVTNPGELMHDDANTHGDETLEWIQRNYREYNGRVWKLINKKEGLLAELRKILAEDMISRDPKIVVSAFAKILLDNFVNKEPNPKWVRID